MPKKPKMRWRKSDLAELQRVVKNFNAKLSRLEKKGADMSIMPDRLSLKDLKASIETRADFNRAIKSAQRFTTKGAEAPVTSSRGAQSTKWAVREFQIAQQAVNRKRAKTLKEIGEQPVTRAGKPTGNTRAEMGKIKENAVKPSKKKFDSMSQKEWEKAMKAIESELSDSKSAAKREAVKENYIKALINEGFSDELQELVKSIPLDDFIKTLDTDEQATFDFVYGKEERDLIEAELTDAWEAAAEKAGIDLDDFYGGLLTHQYDNEE